MSKNNVYSLFPRKKNEEANQKLNPKKSYLLTFFKIPDSDNVVPLKETHFDLSDLYEILSDLEKGVLNPKLGLFYNKNFAKKVSFEFKDALLSLLDQLGGSDYVSNTPSA